MAFSELINRLIPEGSVMAGQTPNEIYTDPSGNQTLKGPYRKQGVTENILQGLMKAQLEAQEKQEAEMKRQQKKMDMYKTLRDSGYEPKRAFESVNKMEFPEESGGLTAEEQVKEAEATKKTAEANKINAQTDRLRQGITGTNTRRRIEEKIANGEELTPGEQKLYDETIKKYGAKGSVQGLIKDKTAPAGNDYVPMLDPTGAKKLVPRDKVEKAKLKGWKLR